jgi:3-oxoacyl-[acyl-carrier protein] reductase
MDLGLKDRVAFVSGGSSGLGLASAVELAREGCLVALCSREAARITRAASLVQERAGVGPERLLPLACDVTEEAQVEAAVTRAAGHFGALHILVTNAGGPPSGTASEFRADQWRAALELNLLSTITLCLHALPHLRRAAAADGGFARILMITSVSAKQPILTLALSNTARAGVQGFAKSLAEELGPEGITVNTLLPGYTRTERLQNLAASIHARTGRAHADIEGDWAQAAALKRIGEPEEFAAALTFLASARASYVTGVAFPVDGGRIKHLL